MPTRRSILFILCASPCALRVWPAIAAEPSLAALINKDRAIAARRGDVGLLDRDPFIDAQDWEIAAFDIAIADTAAGKATATVKFTNFGKPRAVELDLVKIKNDWRISDIAWPRDSAPKTLRGLYGNK